MNIRERAGVWSAMPRAAGSGPEGGSHGAGRIPELDGVRAISIGFVLLLHLTYGRLSGGFLGVDVFFVLSGYLITGLLLKELTATGRVSLRDFYVRRALRIVPPLIIVSLLGLALARVGTAGAGDDARRIPAVLLFYANLQPYEVMGNLVHTWSLAIEEQFYLVWPLLLLLSLRIHWAAPVGVAFAVIAMTVLMRYLMVEALSDATFIYRFTFTRLDGIMLGCLVALLERRLAAGLGALGPVRPRLWRGQA